MVLGELVLMVILLNIVNVIIVLCLLNLVSVEEKEDIIYSFKNNEVEC